LKAHGIQNAQGAFFGTTEVTVDQSLGVFINLDSVLPRLPKYILHYVNLTSPSRARARAREPEPVLLGIHWDLGRGVARAARG